MKGVHRNTHLFRYHLMRSCWEGKAELRPTFSQLLTHLTALLESMADYFDFFAVSNPHSSEDSPPYSSAPMPDEKRGTDATPTDPMPIRNMTLPPLQGTPTKPIQEILPTLQENVRNTALPPIQSNLSIAPTRRAASPRRTSICSSPLSIASSPHKIATPLPSRSSLPEISEIEPNRNTL